MSVETAVQFLNNPARLNAVRSILTSDPRTAESLDRLSQLAARSLGAPVGQINAVTDDRQVSLSSAGPGRWSKPGEAPLELSYCIRAVSTAEPVIVRDSRESPLDSGIADLGVLSYLGVPLKAEPDLVIGAICVVDFVPREWRDEDIELLQQLAQFAMSEIAKRGISDNEILRLMSVVASTHDAIVSVNPEGVVQEWNPAAERLFGYAPAEILGRDARVLVPPGDLERFNAFLERARNGESLPRAVVRRSRKDGSTVRVSVTVTPATDMAGRFVGSTAIMRDLTERVQSDLRHEGRETLFRALIENSSEVITLLSEHGAIQYDSPSVEHVLGYEEHERVGRSIFDYVHPEDVAPSASAFATIVDSTAPLSAEARLKHRDGSYRFFAATCRNLLDDKAVHGIVVNAIDITAIKRAEEELRHAQKMEAVGRLAGGVAHDFNNILTAISGNAHMLMDELPPGSATGDEVREIVQAAARATDLTRQLLAFSRKQFVQPQVTDAGTVVASTTKMLRRLLTEEVRFTVRIAEDAGLVYADPGQLEQVIMNLVVNARDAMPRGGQLNLEVSKAVVEPGSDSAVESTGGPHVVITVSDTGDGMSKAVQEKIFEPFFTTKPMGRGTGLGLSTVYGIVRQNGGFLRVDSELGQGSTFRIYLPRVEGVATPIPIASRVKPQVRGGSETIMLVEDDASIRRLARIVLEKHGYKVIEADGPAAALEIVLSQGAHEVDLLLSDVVMPGMRGPELANRIHAEYPSLQTLFMSGYTEDEVIQPSRTSVPASFIEKPFTPNELLRRIRELLDARGAD